MNTVGENFWENQGILKFGSRLAVRWPYLQDFVKFCLFEAVFYFAYRYGMSFSHVCASPFWFPDSVLLCALLLNRPRRWWIYYSVLFHELTHATGPESRLNRKSVGGSEGEWSAFGSTPYAREELVVEMGAAFLSGHAGIVERTIDNSAAHVQAWLERLKGDTRLVVQAAA